MLVGFSFSEEVAIWVDSTYIRDSTRIALGYSVPFALTSPRILCLCVFDRNPCTRLLFIWRISCQNRALEEGFGMKKKPGSGSFRLLLVEVLHGGEISENGEK